MNNENAVGSQYEGDCSGDTNQIDQKSINIFPWFVITCFWIMDSFKQPCQYGRQAKVCDYKLWILAAQF